MERKRVNERRSSYTHVTVFYRKRSLFSEEVEEMNWLLGATLRLLIQKVIRKKVNIVRHKSIQRILILLNAKVKLLSLMQFSSGFGRRYI